MPNQTITLSSAPAAIVPAGYSKLRAAIASAKVGGLTTTVIVDGEPAAEIYPPGQDRAADVLRALVIKDLGAITARLNEDGVPIVMRVTHTTAALDRLRDRVERFVAGPLSGSSDRSEPDLAGVLAAMALRLGEELHTLGEICDAAGMTRRSPNEIANWLLYGTRS